MITRHLTERVLLKEKERLGDNVTVWGQHSPEAVLGAQLCQPQETEDTRAAREGLQDLFLCEESRSKRAKEFLQNLLSVVHYLMQNSTDL